MIEVFNRRFWQH